MQKISFKQFLEEKIALSKYREIYKQIGQEYRERYNDWFGGKYRIYLPLSGAVSDPLYQEVNNALSKNDYEIADWNSGLAKSKKTTRTQRIGRLLGTLKEDSLLKKFNERHKGREVSKEKEEDLLVCISRHPLDIAGMSTDRQELGFKNVETGEWKTDKETQKLFATLDRQSEEYYKMIRTWQPANKGWTSCKHVNRENAHYIPTEIDAGALVAYVIRPTDKNIQKPLSRLLIIPLFNENDPDDTVLYVGDKFYGKSITSFKTVVEDWLEEHQGETDISEYCLDTDKVYNDGYDELNVIRIEKLRNALRENKWEVVSIDANHVKAYTYWLFNLDNIFLNEDDRDNYSKMISRYFDKSIDTGDIDPESWEYDDNLRDKVKEIGNNYKSLANKIIEQYKEAGGTEEEWGDIVDDLENQLPDLTNDISNWYEEQKNEKWLESTQEQFVRALHTTWFSLIQDDNRWRLWLHCEREDYESLYNWLNGDYDLSHDFDVDDMITNAYDEMDEVNYHTFKNYLESILD